MAHSSFHIEIITVLFQTNAYLHPIVVVRPGIVDTGNVLFINSLFIKLMVSMYKLQMFILNLKP